MKTVHHIESEKKGEGSEMIHSSFFVWSTVENQK